MFEILFKIWYMIAILPFLVFLEGNKMFSDFLKKRNIYSGWGIWHSFIVVLVTFLIILLANGYR